MEIFFPKLTCLGALAKYSNSFEFKGKIEIGNNSAAGFYK